MKKIHPKHGEERIVKFFAFLPVTVKYKIDSFTYRTAETRWLETVTVKQKYNGIGDDGSFPYWYNICFIDD